MSHHCLVDHRLVNHCLVDHGRVGPKRSAPRFNQAVAAQSCRLVTGLPIGQRQSAIRLARTAMRYADVSTVGDAFTVNNQRLRELSATDVDPSCPIETMKSASQIGTPIEVARCNVD